MGENERYEATTVVFWVHDTARRKRYGSQKRSRRYKRRAGLMVTRFGEGSCNRETQSLARR